MKPFPIESFSFLQEINKSSLHQKSNFFLGELGQNFVNSPCALSVISLINLSSIGRTCSNTLSRKSDASASHLTRFRCCCPTLSCSECSKWLVCPTSLCCVNFEHIFLIQRENITSRIASTTFICCCCVEWTSVCTGFESKLNLTSLFSETCSKSISVRNAEK